MQQHLEERGEQWVDEHGSKLLEKLFRRQKTKRQYSKFIEKLKKEMHKIKNELAKETKENKEMIDTYYSYIRGQATREEMHQANEQFRELLKTIGMGALIVVPFSPVTIPFFVKIGNALGINILPKWFKNRHETGET